MFILEISTKHVLWPQVNPSMHGNQNMRGKLHEFVSCTEVILYKSKKFSNFQYKLHLHLKKPLHYGNDGKMIVLLWYSVRSTCPHRATYNSFKCTVLCKSKLTL